MYTGLISSLVISVIAGFTVGKMVKKSGWFYGGMIGFMKWILDTGFNINSILDTYIKYGKIYSSELQFLIDPQNLSGYLFLIVFTAFGGWLGTKNKG